MNWQVVTISKRASQPVLSPLVIRKLFNFVK